MNWKEILSQKDRKIKILIRPRTKLENIFTCQRKQENNYKRTKTIKKDMETLIKILIFQYLNETRLELIFNTNLKRNK